MTDERMLILRMLEQGKITAEEAAELLDALRTESDFPDDPAEDTGDERFDQAMAKAREYIEKMRERIEEGVQKVRVTVREKGPSREDIDHAVKQFQRGIANVLDELPDVLARLGSFEFRTKPGHTFEEEFAGRLTVEQPVEIVVHNAAGGIEVKAGDDSLSYRVKVINRVHVEDENEARRLSEASIVWHATDAGFELKAGTRPKVTAKIVITLPRHLLYQADLVSETGSLVWRGVNASSLTISSEDGSIVLEDVKTERVQVQGANGSVRLKDVHAASTHVSTGNGSIRFTGSSPDLHLRTENGSVRCVFAVNDEEPERHHGHHQWDIGTANGSVTVKVPGGGAFGYRCDLRAEHGRVLAELPSFVEEGGADPSHIAGASRDFDAKPIQMTLKVRTGSGLIRIETADREETAE